MCDMKSKTTEELAARQKLLEDEIECSRDEIEMMQRELNSIYDEQHRRSVKGKKC